MVLKSSGKLAVIWKNPDSFEIIRKIGYHLENPYSFEIIRKIGSHLEKSGQFWNNPENWQSSGKSRQFWNHLENWQSSGKSGQFWNHPENWQSSGKKSGQFWNHPENWKSSGKIRIVLKVLRQFKRFFRLYAQKLSGRAKTFRVAMLPCYPGFSASGSRTAAGWGIEWPGHPGCQHIRHPMYIVLKLHGGFYLLYWFFWSLSLAKT